MPLTDHQRHLRAKIAGYESWANTENRSARTAPARAARRRKLEQRIDPEGVIAPAELKARADAAEKAELARTSFLASKKQRTPGGAVDAAT
jgi:hypothetical protein